jgi:biotin transport system substrate-specific component|tara:strand:+ start:617 stop:826 length:210 start_codon:yes stop_codon:yes gene_type:complete
MQSVKYLENSKIIKNFLVMVFGTIIIAVSSKIQTPYSPVPITMQTFAVLFLGIVLGYKLAVATVVLYLI